MTDVSHLVRPFREPARGLVAVPGSKSITNRALILAALANGETVLEGALFSRDTHLLCQALKDLNFEVEADAADQRIRIVGQSGLIPLKTATLKVGNAGTAARFLTAMLALSKGGRYELDGDAAMRARPMAGLLHALEQGGCRLVTPEGKPALGFPFILESNGLTKTTLRCDAKASSQILSALLMVMPLVPGLQIELEGSTVSEPFVLMTERLMAAFGRPIVRVGSTWNCPNPGPYYAQPRYLIEPDATAASYFIGLGSVSGKGTRLRLKGYSKEGLQGDVAFAQVAQQCGAQLKHGVDFTLVENWQAHRGGTFNFNDFSDTFLTLAALAPLADEPTTLTGIGHTRKQETDRVLAMATELERLGVKVVPTAATLRTDTSASTLTIYPSRDALIKSSKTQPVSIHTYEDHRMAMSFGILGSYDLHGDGRPWLSIEDPACVNKTFPNFFAALEILRGKFVCVAVDGGAASGKSSTSRLLAAEQGLLHVDTGSHYRAVTLALLRAGGSAERPDSIPKLLDKLSVSSTILGQAAWVSICGTTPSAQDLRRPEVTASVSAFSAIPAVRNFLLNYQRDQVRLAEEGGFTGVVMEGRDIGSVVLPQAEVRIFLEADTVVRSARRAAEGVHDAIAQRDQADASRATAPLTCPAGAVRIDNTKLSLAEVVGQIGQHIKAARLRA